MSDWQGPWKCKKCNRTFTHDELARERTEPHHLSLPPSVGGGIWCDGKLIPYERRASPAPTGDTLRAIIEAEIDWLEHAEHTEALQGYHRVRAHELRKALASPGAEGEAGRREPWISVKERLPDYAVPVLVACRDYPVIFSATYEESERRRMLWWHVPNYGYSKKVEFEVTHWRKLPPLPSPPAHGPEGGK